MKLAYSDFFTLTTARGMDVILIETSDNYFVYASEDNIALESQIIKNTEDATSFETLYKSKCNLKRTDVENSEVVRVKFCKLGWRFWHFSFEFESSVLGSLAANRYDAPCSATTIRFLNSSREELTTQLDIDTNCTITQLVWQPSMDIEILCGKIRQKNKPTEPVLLFTRIAPDIPSASGGQVDFQSNFNLQYLDAGIELIVDGRASKYITYYEGVPANKIIMEFRHPAGFKHKAQITLEFFRA